MALWPTMRLPIVAGNQPPAAEMNTPQQPSGSEFDQAPQPIPPLYTHPPVRHASYQRGQRKRRTVSATRLTAAAKRWSAPQPGFIGTSNAVWEMSSAPARSLVTSAATECPRSRRREEAQGSDGLTMSSVGRPEASLPRLLRIAP